MKGHGNHRAIRNVVGRIWLELTKSRKLLQQPCLESFRTLCRLTVDTPTSFAFDAHDRRDLVDIYPLQVNHHGYTTRDCRGQSLNEALLLYTWSVCCKLRSHSGLEGSFLSTPPTTRADIPFKDRLSLRCRDLLDRSSRLQLQFLIPQSVQACTKDISIE